MIIATNALCNLKISYFFLRIHNQFVDFNAFRITNEARFNISNVFEIKVNNKIHQRLKIQQSNEFL